MLSIWLEVASEVKERRRANTAHRNLRPPSLHGQAGSRAPSRPGCCRDEPEATRKFGFYFQDGACLHLVIISQLLSAAERVFTSARGGEPRCQDAKGSAGACGSDVQSGPLCLPVSLPA